MPKEYEASAEARSAYKAWATYREIPPGDEVKHTKVFDDLHRLDKRPWEGECGVFAICSHACQQWTRQMIVSPNKLRQPSKKYPGLYQWQVIVVQIVQGGRNGRMKEVVAETTDEFAEAATPEADPDCPCAKTDGAPGFTRTDGKMVFCPVCELGQYMGGMGI